MGNEGRDPEPAGDPTRHPTALIPPRLRHAFLVVAVVATAAACGSNRAPQQQRAAPAPKLPRPVARRLAREADAVALALRRRNVCSAKRLAARLRSDATASIGRVPARLQEPLSGGVNVLLSELPRCIPPKPVTTVQPTTPTTTPAAPVHHAAPPRHEPKHDHRPKPPKHGHDHGGPGHGKKDK
jgi:hypothetical protein